MMSTSLIYSKEYASDKPKILLPRDVLYEPSTDSLINWLSRSYPVFMRVARNSYAAYDCSELFLIQSGFSHLLQVAMHPTKALTFFLAKDRSTLLFFVDLCDELVVHDTP